MIVLSLVESRSRINVFPTPYCRVKVPIWTTKEMVQGWSKRAPLSRGQASVFRDLLMSAMTVPFVFADVEHSSNVLDGQSSTDSAFKRSLDGIAVPRHEQFVYFWVIHD